jgi:pyruvate/2-oxoglutarate dehydrogenase complex dihydrolipoamide dehydrogenase (E3) component
MIKKKGFDAVLVAAGAAPIIPDIPGADGRHVLAPIFAYNNKALGKEIVVIGGEQIGTETGMYLAENGHNVTVLTTGSKLAADANGIYLSVERWGHLKNFSYITGAAVKKISKENVIYVDAKGGEKSIPADNVVIYAGRRPRQAEAMKFYGAANRFFMIGDCSSEGDIINIIDGNLRSSLVTAFSAASKI